MPHIHIKSFNTKKYKRKLKIAIEMKYRKMKAVFAQLSPCDEMRIINKLNKEKQGIKNKPGMYATLERLNQAYKYAKQITNTIEV